jgi:apolipoprotein N-acyltransferase
MARVRAIEGGFSLLRPARAGLSAAFDPYGRVRASMSAWEENDRVMLATVPARPLRTLYAQLGDGAVVILAALLLGGAVLAGRRFTR